MRFQFRGPHSVVDVFEVQHKTAQIIMDWVLFCKSSNRVCTHSKAIMCSDRKKAHHKSEAKLNTGKGLTKNGGKGNNKSNTKIPKKILKHQAF